MEKGDPTVSVDLLVKSLLALGADKKSIARAIAWRASQEKHELYLHIFFTVDEHHGHANIIKYCNRPFTSVDEMDAEIIQRHNEMVGSKDVADRRY